MNIDSKRIDRLIEQSKSKSYDAYTRFDWPENVAVDRLWCNEDLLTTYGTDVHGTLTDQQLFELSKWEAINFFSLNVHGIKTVLEFVCQCFYNKRYNDISNYLHIFLAEENSHMWFFAKFCQLYGNKIYPSNSINFANEGDELEHDLYMFCSTLVFEEFVDFYNRKVGLNENVAPIVREINHQHHQDEARHVSFGREIVKQLYNDIVDSGASPEQLAKINKTIKNIIIYFVGLMYNPSVYNDSNIVESSGFKNSAAMRNALRNSDERKVHHGIWFRNTANFFHKAGIIDDTSFLTTH